VPLAQPPEFANCSLDNKFYEAYNFSAVALLKSSVI